MKLYAETSSLRLRQQLADTATLGWVTVWLFVGRALYRTIEQLRVATGEAEAAGAGFADRLDDVARTAAGVPLVGGELRRPFTGAADAGRVLQSAGATAGDTVHALALWIGLLVALVPIAWVLPRYLPGRLRWMREAGAAAHLRIDADDLQLFALRAVARAPLHELRRAVPDPAAALARGDYEALAGIELARLGLTTPLLGASDDRSGR
jgi:hypothetical protein